MKPSLKAARDQLYRDAILSAAEAVFAEHTYSGARIQKIAALADVSVGTIYGLFGSKAELFATTRHLHLNEVATIAARAAATAASPLAQLDRGIDAYVRYLLAHPNFLRIHLTSDSWGLGPHRGTETELDGWRRGLDLLAVMIKRAIDDGTVIGGHPTLLARSLAALQQVHLAHWVETGMREDAATVAKRLKNTFRKMYCVDRDWRPLPLETRP